MTFGGSPFSVQRKSIAVSYRPASVPSGPEIRCSSSWTISSGRRGVDPELNRRARLVPPRHRRELVGGRDDQGRPVVVDVLVDDVDRKAAANAQALSRQRITHPRVGRDPVLPVVELARRTTGRRGAGRGCPPRPSGRRGVLSSAAGLGERVRSAAAGRPRGRSRSASAEPSSCAPDLLAAGDQQRRALELLDRQQSERVPHQDRHAVAAVVAPKPAQEDVNAISPRYASVFKY